MEKKKLCEFAKTLTQYRYNISNYLSPRSIVMLEKEEMMLEREVKEKREER